jgi:hypothetical protein
MLALLTLSLCAFGAVAGLWLARPDEDAPAFNASNT